MDKLLQSVQNKPVLFVGGKGGVGKTTHAASIACRLAESGRKVLLVSTDPAHSLGDVLQTSLSGTIRQLTDNLSALELNPHKIVEQHFAQVEATLSGYAKPEMLPQLKQHLEASKSSPGAEEAAMLEALCRYVVHHRLMGFEQVVFDTAPTGHTLRLLELPQMMSAWTESLLAQQGRQQKLREAALPFWQKSEKENTVLSEAKSERWQKALQVLQKRQQLFAEAGKRLGDAAQTGIILVMTAEMLPLAETRRAVAQLHHFNLPCGHLIVNQLMPEPEQNQPFWQQRYERQQEILLKIRQDFAGLQIYEYGLQAADIRGTEALAEFGKQGLISLSAF
ncbi:ArsA family ATPase [Neisseria weaveri]|uniref:ArsA family ATPase n=1 Tax=Neisseria weaveri TaxID=28091 RepID=UPI001F2A582F|nr:ArsA family ATPase [Neisseria weaveri]